MDPVTIGATVALLAAKRAGEKALEKAAERVGEKSGEAGWGLGAKILDKVRGLFSYTSDEALQELEAVEAAAEPSDEQVNGLAATVSKQLEVASKVAGELAPMIEAAHNDPELAPLLSTAGSVAEGSMVITQTVSNSSGVVQIGSAGGDINVDVKGATKPSKS